MFFRPPAFSTWVYPISLRILLLAPRLASVLQYTFTVSFLSGIAVANVFHFLSGNIDAPPNVLLLIPLWNTNIDPAYSAAKKRAVKTPVPEQVSLF